MSENYRTVIYAHATHVDCSTYQNVNKTDFIAKKPSFTLPKSLKSFTVNKN